MLLGLNQKKLKYFFKIFQFLGICKLFVDKINESKATASIRAELCLCARLGILMEYYQERGFNCSNLDLGKPRAGIGWLPTVQVPNW